MIVREFRAAWSAYKSHPGAFIAATLVLFASWVALELTVVALHRFGVVPNVLIHLAWLLLFCGLMAGFHNMAAEALDGRAPRLKRLTESLGRGPSYLAATLLYVLGVLLGLACLVAPGVYVAVRYVLFGPVIAATPASAHGRAETGAARSAVEALREAGSLTDGRWWVACRFYLAALALNLAGAALLGLGLLVSVPVAMLATAGFHRTLIRTPAQS